MHLSPLPGSQCIEYRSLLCTQFLRPQLCRDFTQTSPTYVFRGFPHFLNVCLYKTCCEKASKSYKITYSNTCYFGRLNFDGFGKNVPPTETKVFSVCSKLFILFLISPSSCLSCCVGISRLEGLLLNISYLRRLCGGVC